MKSILEYLLVSLAIVLFVSSCYHEDNRIFASCDDGILNQSEEFVDCGGPNCLECPPSCDNGILDWVAGWQETGVDCGGPCEDEGLFCCENGILDINPFDPTVSENWVDCRWEFYPPGHPNFPNPITTNSGYPGSLSDCPICDPCENGYHDDGEQIVIGFPPNEEIIETVDCGGPSCVPCVDLCNDGLVNGGEGPCADCGGVCPSCNFSHCSNGVIDTFGPDNAQNEIGIDCGGCGCPTCPELCDDGILNGLEEAIDCGVESGCVACNDPILCGDGVQNGFEDGIDCYDGTDGLSACPPCATLCTNGVQDGVETDIDCGGPIVNMNGCLPCASDEVFLVYTVDGVLYESVFASINYNLDIGDATLQVPDVLTIQGGAAHSMQIVLNDDEYQQPGIFDANYIGGPNDNWFLNFGAASPGSVSFTDNDGSVFTSANSSTGITVDVTAVNFLTAPIFIEGTFSGTVSDGLGLPTSNRAITGGAFRIEL
jgi:hypothetical protein